MIVASRARDRKPHRAACHNVDSIINDVRLVIQEPASERQEPECSQRALIIAEGQAVGGNLLDDELVVGQIVVERANDVIAVSIGIGIAPLFLENISLGVGIACDVEPISGPSLAVVRRIQQSFHDPGKGLRRLIGQKVANFVGGRRQANQIEGRPANQRPFIRGRVRRDLLCSEPRQDECVDGRLNPPFAGDLGQIWTFYRLKGPMIRRF